MPKICKCQVLFNKQQQRELDAANEKRKHKDTNTNRHINERQMSKIGAKYCNFMANLAKMKTTKNKNS